MGEPACRQAGPKQTTTYLKTKIEPTQIAQLLLCSAYNILTDMQRRILTLATVVIISCGALFAQSKVYLHVSGQGGRVVQTERDKSIGIGGTLGVMISDTFLFNSDNGYLTFSVKGFNNPYNGGKFVTSIMNDKNDAFNYLQFLAGYRYTTFEATNGLYIEPRVGANLVSLFRPGFAFSPVMGFTAKGFDIGVFADMGFHGVKTSVGYNNFTTVGLSVGYNLGF